MSDRVILFFLVAVAGLGWIFGTPDAHAQLAILPAIIGGLASIAGGLIGSGSSAGDRDAQIRAYEQSVKDMEAIGIPSEEAQKIVLEQYQSEGKWTPELDEAVKMGDSSQLGVSTDPAYKEAQLRALGKMSEIGDSGGMTLEDNANLERIQGEVGQQERGNREAIMQSAAQRGDLGSGATLAAQLQNAQGAATRRHQGGLDVAAQARDRAFAAIEGAGRMGGSMREQEFGEKSKAAEAQDAIARWNAENTQAVRSANTGVKNQAAQWNLNNQQNLSNANTDTRNKTQTYNKALPQQRFQNEMDVAKAKAGARAGQAQSAGAAAQANANMWAGIGSGVAQGTTAVGQMQNANEQKALDRAAYGTKPPTMTTMGPGSMPRYAPDEDDRFKSIS